MSTPNNLPAELTSFVGREPQLAELRRLLRRSRLVTLTGPGGAGKTRLALRLAAECLERFPDGVWLMDLAPIGDLGLLEQTLAVATGIHQETQRSVSEVLVTGLSGRHTLIVLDGCEHLVDASADFASLLLRSCPKLHIIATTREPLGITGEVIWRTPSLTIPRPEDTGRPELLMESESIRLFVDRARLSRPDFELQTADGPALAQICTRLEGIPLAIELAAGLAGVMTLEEILERLRHRFRLLTGGSRSSLPRHQTLRQAVDWSYGLLSPNEQALFARVGVFAGGFDLAAAEAVVNGDPITIEEVLPLLTRLVNKSLVGAEAARPHTTRYRMLDTIREYAQEKLQQVGVAEWRRKHADYIIEWAGKATTHLQSVDQMVWMRLIDEEQPNIRTALEWTLSEQPDNALRLAATMGDYWWMRRSFVEGIESLDRALEIETSHREYRPRCLLARARINRRRGDLVAARRDAEECADIARELGLDYELGRAVTMLGITYGEMGDTPTSLRYFNQAMELAEKVGDRQRIAATLNNIALTESLLGDQASAMRALEQAIAISDELGDRWMFSVVLDTVAVVNYRLGERDAARRNWEEALSVSLEFDDAINIADCLDGMALLAMSSGDAQRAMILIGAAQGLRERLGAGRPLATHEVLDAEQRAAQKLLRAAADEARRKGGAMSMREAVGYALGTSGADRRDGAIRLTGREIEVARLLAAGMTNADVAHRLHISDRTVDAHVDHIRNKLGLRSRAQIAVWASERLSGVGGA